MVFLRGSFLVPRRPINRTHVIFNREGLTALRHRPVSTTSVACRRRSALSTQPDLEVLNIPWHLLVVDRNCSLVPRLCLGTPLAVASIWFEMWGSWIRVKKIDFFPGKFPINFDFLRQFHTKNRFS